MRSPSQRAAEVWKIIKAQNPHITDWDVLCFSVEYLGMISPVYPWIEEAAKNAAKLVYTAHYIADHVPSEPVNNVAGTQPGTEPTGDGPRSLLKSEPLTRSSADAGAPVHLRNNSGPTGENVST